MATQDTHPDKLESDLDIRREVHAKFATIDATSVGKSIYSNKVCIRVLLFHDLLER